MLRFADLERDADLVDAAREAADELLARDPARRARARRALARRRGRSWLSA